MHVDTWLEPSYVSFLHVRLYEGYAPPINRQGWYQDLEMFPDDRLEHGDAAGAGSGTLSGSVAITEIENRTDGGDLVAAFVSPTNTYYYGSYQLSIPLYWFVEEGGSTNLLENVVQSAWIYSNGTMRINKFGVTWERWINGLECQVEE